MSTTVLDYRKKRMARSIGMSITKPAPVYRAVILYLYPGIHNRKLEVYTAHDGQEYSYHRVEAYGPYGTRGPATAQVTSALRSHETAVKQGYYTHRNEWDSQTRSYNRVPSGESIPEVTAFVESQVPAWTPVAGTERIA